MTLEDLIISTYCFVDDYLNESNLTHLRRRGELPALSDAGVITMEIVDKYLGHGFDKTIWAYFKEHWRHFFPRIMCRISFSR